MYIDFRAHPGRKLFLGILALCGLTFVWHMRIQKHSTQFYTSGDFIKHHMESTPQFEIQGMSFFHTHCKNRRKKFRLRHPTLLSDTPVKQLIAQNIGYSAAILYLVNLYRLRELLLSMSYLYNNVPMKPWPILFMYADDLDDESKRTEFMLRMYDFLGSGQKVRWFMDRIEWIRLEWKLPDTISHDKSVVQPVFGDSWPGKSFVPFLLSLFFRSLYRLR